MLRRFLVVARPDDPAGRAVAWATRIFAAVLLLGSLLSRLPAPWVEAAFGQAWLVRLALAAVSLSVADAVGTILASRLPRAPYLVWNRLALPTWGLPRHVPTREIASVRVELRPDPWGETIVVRLRDGTDRDVCPLRWPQAGRLYERLARKTHGRRQMAARIGAMQALHATRARRGGQARIS